MKNARISFRGILASLMLGFVCLRASGEGWKHGVAATVHPLATDAAVAAMAKGGNAVDAAIAAALTLGVVDGFNSGIGGGCFLLIRRPDGSLVAIDGRETAPAKATRDMYLRDGKADARLSQFGALAVGVPGSLAAYEHASVNFGKLPFRQLLEAAADVAERGFELGDDYVSRLKQVAEPMRKFKPAAAIFLRPDGMPKEKGDILRQPDLARSYRAIAREGSGWFYKGAFAEATGNWMRENGGIATKEDFRGYKILLREPIVTTYRQYQIVGFPPPSSGGVHVAQILNILENLEVNKLRPNAPKLVHYTTEAMKLAFADRAFWLGDPDFARVPKGLLEKDYARRLFAGIDPARATKVESHGEFPDANENYFGKHTTHFSTADAEGNWVACTATVNTTFGSLVVIPGTGIVLNNQMDDFSIQPGAPNFFGLVGAEANAVGPNKRPLSSMSPTIVLENGKPVLSIGAAGGPTIISQTVLGLVNRLDFGMEIGPALGQARFHHQWLPDELLVEKKMPVETVSELKALGHKVSMRDLIGAAQAVGLDHDGKGLTGAHDPRLRGKAGGL